jgi:meso-butanediol dehydrogenase/(S,S)-butanediol dehydrogenase/diacetyl reductase
VSLNDFSNRTVVVTGAAGTIGGAVVAAFMERGARVIGIDRVEASGIHRADVTDEGGLRAAIEASAGSLLTDVVHAAGIVEYGPILQTSDERIAEVLRVNLISAFVILRACVPLMTGGTITMIGSQAASHGSADWALYSASKAGVIRLVESAAKEFGPRGIRVNAINPGSVNSPMMDAVITAKARRLNHEIEDVRRSYEETNPLRRFVEPHEVAAACVFLASPESSFINGAAINVDGGDAPE